MFFDKMRTVDLIVKKRKGEALEQEEIEFLVQNYVEGRIPDYQMAAFCMAVYFQGMNTAEVAQLTMAMAHSGEMVDLAPITGVKVDKHSTGGVADTTTLVLGPLVAAAGVPMAKMSGRGLGHTGGTIDKLESIPGFQTTLSREAFIKQVNVLKIALVGQSGNLVPADKKLYALRDVTGTVPSIPLIASSIMSKKIAAGADKLVLDVKVGSGAFMKKKEDAIALAETMVQIGEQVGRETVALVTSMEEPLGTAIGNALEVEEAILVLQGQKQGALRELCLLLGAEILVLTGRVRDRQEGRTLLENLLISGAALEKFVALVAAQGGNPAVAQDTSLLPQAAGQEVVQALPEQEGYVAAIDAERLGVAAMTLGAGRAEKDDPIDLAVGMKLHVRQGDRVTAGQPLATLYYNKREKLEQALKLVRPAFRFSQTPVAPEPLVYALVTKKGVTALNGHSL
jgi:pyrimidine-nucleoside phosphorylase